MKYGFSVSSVLAALLAVATSATAQVTQISPGAIGNENQRNQEQLEKSHPAPQTAPQESPVIGPNETETASPASNIRFDLKAVTFDTSKFLTPDELNTIANEYVGHTIGFADLQAMIKKINELYKSKGQVTARAVLPPQKIANGAVHIALIEGKLGAVSVKGAARTAENYFTNRIVLAPGDTVDVKDLSRQVVFFNRTNDVQVRALLKPGASFGMSDVELDVTEPDANLTQVFVDNKGVSSTGRIEGGIYYRHHDLFGIDDKASLFGTFSRGGIDGTASYSAPLDTRGDRASISYERNHINVLNGPFGDLGITGNGQTVTIGVTRPYVATEHWLALAVFNQSFGSSNSAVADGPITDTRTYRTTGGISATYIGSSLLASLAPNLTFAHSHNDILDEGQNAVMFTGSGSALLLFGDSWSAHLATSWQYTAAKQLPADLLFQIGGPTSVRGYQSGTFAGDSGYFANVELHRNLDVIQGLDLFAFFDSGSVFATSPSVRSLYASGVGGVLHLTQTIGLSTSIGMPMKTAIPGEKDYQLYIQLAASF